MQKLIVTCALPYANGSLHFGHILEQIQADIWVRFHKMQSYECYFICATDTHGTPIMLKAQHLGIPPEELIKSVHQDHLADLNAFGISFDNYYNTHSQESELLVYQIYNRLKQNNKIYSKVINQLYDEEKGMFLPDRFIKGTCPKCRAVDQYGDNCEACGTTYSPMDLIDAYSTISGSKPVIKESEHYFFKLSECGEFLKKWLDTDNRLQVEAKNKMQEWLESGLQDWDISRDKPYFGFPIPDTHDKFFYVWLDAPVGYLASLLNFCNTNNINYDDLWQDDNVKLYHFIGKDVLYFHALFWPAVLHYSNYKTPQSVFVHGFLTVDGQKMSKSRGTFITAKSYLQSGLSPTFYRYYIASKLSNKIEDIDLSLDDFIARVNSELVGKFINIAARSSSFLSKNFDNKLCAKTQDNSLLDQVLLIKETVAKYYTEREYNKAIRTIMAVVDEINVYVDNTKPWILAKDPAKQEELHQVCSILINAFRLISIYLKPVVPDLIAKIEEFLNISPLMWSDLNSSLCNHAIKPYSHLISRIEPKMIENMLEINKASINDTNVPSNIAAENSIVATQYEAIAETVNIDDFAKIDLRVARIIDAKHVEGADKLLQITLDIGSEQRNVFAGIKSAYNPVDLIGKHTIMVANLAPRKMKFGLSEGMILAASSEDKNSGIYILEPDEGAKPGMRVR
ncbi:MAG: methionine--tRNA ligase [Burkholderiales bacterium]|jgi:methionyl-tRNA synthetase|nr:methionine--tRNA ligase [Burkholderiales bacterium]